MNQQNLQSPQEFMLFMTILVRITQLNEDELLALSKEIPKFRISSDQKLRLLRKLEEHKSFLKLQAAKSKFQ